MSLYAIKINELQRDFNAIHAVDKVSFSVLAGIVFGFLGPNGAGKTTTIRLLLGLLQPNGGNAEVLGFDIYTQSNLIRQNCGALLEHHGLYERLSAEDNLDFYGHIWKLNHSERNARIHELLCHIGLWERRKEIVQEWSRGMKQKLAVVRALIHRPRLVFMDEPTAGLDPISAASLREDLASLAKNEGVTVFLTTHNLAEAEKLCHQVGVIRQGKLAAIGSPEDLRTRRGSPHVIIRGNGFSENVLCALRSHPSVISASLHNGSLQVEYAGEKTAPLVNFLVANGVQIEEVSREKASLEEVFINLIEEEK